MEADLEVAVTVRVRADDRDKLKALAAAITGRIESAGADGVAVADVQVEAGLYPIGPTTRGPLWTSWQATA